MSNLIHRIFIYIGTVVFMLPKLHAQSPDFSQTYTNYIYTNSAFIGIDYCPKVYASTRYKNYANGVTYSSSFLSFDMYLKKINSEIGVVFLHDIQGQRYINSTFQGLWSKRFKLKKHLMFKPGIAIGGGVHETGSGGLIFSDMIDPLLGIYKDTDEKIAYFQKPFFDSEIGMLLYSNSFFLGLTVKHLNHFTKSHSYVTKLFLPQISLQSGGKYSSTNGFSNRSLLWLYPQLNVTITRESSYAQVGMVLQKKQLQIGGGYRQNLPVQGESFVIFVGFVEKKFKFAYNCDVIIKTDVGNNFNIHEVSLVYQFDCVEKRKKYEAVMAPIL